MKLKKKNLGKRKTLYELKDWGISRQRYWGCPIPMIYLEDGSVVPVEKSELPIELPEDINLESREILWTHIQLGKIRFKNLQEKSCERN